MNVFNEDRFFLEHRNRRNKAKQKPEDPFDERGVDVGYVGSWAADFGKLLADPIGLNVFSEFLKKEFCYENIDFWLTCESFRKLADKNELKNAAQDIYDKYLCFRAPEPINVDSKARMVAHHGLQNPTPELFKLAQEQV